MQTSFNPSDMAGEREGNTVKVPSTENKPNKQVINQSSTADNDLEQNRKLGSSAGRRIIGYVHGKVTKYLGIRRETKRVFAGDSSIFFVVEEQ